MPLTNAFGRLVLSYGENASAEFQEEYGYPSTADVAVFDGDNNGHVHVIVDTVDPNASSNYDKAPFGSLYIRKDSTNSKIFIKNASTSWVVVGAQTA